MIVDNMRNVRRATGEWFRNEMWDIERTVEGLWSGQNKQ